MGRNILDLIFISEENMIKNLSVREHFGTGDLQIIRWNMLAYNLASNKIMFPKVIKKQIKSYNYNKGEYDKIRDEAGSINWNEIVTENNVESDWSRLKLFFEKMRDKFIPFKNSKIKQNRWITRAVIECRRAKK